MTPEQLADLGARLLSARDERWALNTDAICARKLLEATERARTERERQTSEQG